MYSPATARNYPAQHFHSKQHTNNHSITSNNSSNKPAPVPGSMNGGGGGGGSSSYHRQLDMANVSRSTSSPHHHARLAIASARQNPDQNGVVPEKPSQWTCLDLGGMQIRNLAPEIFRYGFLTTLYLNHNNLVHLDPQVSLLINLKMLDISGNKLSSIPHDLGMLHNLTQLLMFDNELTTLPHELGFLYQLDTLGLEGNPVASSEPILSLMQKDSGAVVQYLRDNCPVGLPPPEREWISLEDEMTTNQADSFTILCYNTLCDKYATPQSYAYTPSWVLNWEYRKELILQEILNYNADIVCLQEMETSQYEEYFREQMAQHGEYDSLFYPKSRSRTMDEYSRKGVDGCATFWKTNKFFLIEKQLIEFQQIAMQRPELRKTEDVYNRVMIKDNIAVITLLEAKDSGSRIIVANAHLHWDPQYKDVKLVQTAMLMEEMQIITQKWSALPSRHPIHQYLAANPQKYPSLVVGDFNSLPSSGVYEFLSQSSVSQDHEDFGSYKYGRYTSEGLANHITLRSAYSHVDEGLDFTNYTPTFKGVIDYVWYSTNSFIVTGLLANVDKEYVKGCIGFPNWHHPSDHIPLVVSLKIKALMPTTPGARTRYIQ